VNRPAPLFMVLAFAGALTAGGPTSCTDHGAGATGESAFERVGGSALRPRLTGTWVLEEQVFPDRPHQRRWDRLRELTLNTDGTFVLDLGHLERAGRWEPGAGTVRLHETLREGVDMVSKPPPADPAKLAAWRPAEVRHVNVLTLQRLSGDRLVVLEDDPQEVFGNHLPPKGRVRNTYRRKVAGDFGPMLGARRFRHAPGAGRFAAAFEYSRHKLPTMEITSDEGIVGAAMLTLNADGSATLCVGMRETSTFSASQYAPGGARRDARDVRRLLAWSGRWTSGAGGQPDGGVTLTLERAVWNTCDFTSPESRAYPIPPVTVACAGLRANDRLPVDVLACRLDGPLRQLEPLALNPADSHRAGPYTFQLEPMGHLRVEPGVPWLLLGAAGGLRIASTDDRDAGSPKVTFTREDVRLPENEYVMKREPPDGAPR
jgi:hypothetical protein